MGETNKMQTNLVKDLTNDGRNLTLSSLANKGKVELDIMKNLDREDNYDKIKDYVVKSFGENYIFDKFNRHSVSVEDEKSYVLSFFDARLENFKVLYGGKK
jgi:hypothetical protein